MDAFLVKQIVAELAAELRGALVSKVHQPAEKEIVLTLWTGREEKRLLLSADPESCRIHLSTRKVPIPLAALVLPVPATPHGGCA
jgi:predicted ribosome quality control (RQC) complex YloA/Tae2 family protein